MGDAVEKALATVGITSEKVEKFLGRPCGCRKRRDKLNALSAWVRARIRGRDAPLPDGLEIQSPSEDKTGQPPTPPSESTL